MLKTKSSLEDLNYHLTLEQVKTLSPVQRQFIINRCQTDLRFLVNCVLRPNNERKFPTLLEKVHGPIIDAFLSPDPKIPLDEWDTRDEFVIMASRGMLKSTIGMAFLTQLILCEPDIRILIMSGKIEKAQSILAGARKPFITNEVIRELFPEWAVNIDSIRAEDFICPMRNHTLDLRDPTLSIASFDSVKAGGHYEVILLDDATNEINSSSVENCEKTHGTYDDTDELLEPGGYRLFLATKWHPDDLPEYIRKKGEEDAAVSGETTVSYFVQPAWRLRTDGTPREVAAREDREKNGQLRPEDVILTWPEKLNAKFLFKRYRKNRDDFYKQYLLNASLSETPKSFPEEVLNRQITAANDLLAIPYHDRSVVIHWDFASAFTGRRKKSETDYTCGIIAVFQNSTQKMWVVQVVLAHISNAKEAAQAMVRLYRIAEYYGEIVGHSVEDAMGARWLESAFDDEVLATTTEDSKSVMPILWELPENELNAKNGRISLLASAMQAGHAYLLANIQFLEDVRTQFEDWSIDAKRRKDDAPDCIAQVWKYYRPLILPRTITNMQPSEPVVGWSSEPQPDTSANANNEAQQDEQQMGAYMADILTPYKG